MTDHIEEIFETDDPIELPNIFDDLPLSVYAVRLYVKYKRIAGADLGGCCCMGMRRLAEECGMSLGKLSQARKELTKPQALLGGTPLIKVVQGDRRKNETDKVYIANIWSHNDLYFKNLKQKKEETRPHGHHMNACVHIKSIAFHKAWMEKALQMDFQHGHGVLV